MKRRNIIAGGVAVAGGAALAAAAPAAVSAKPSRAVRTGIERLVDDDFKELEGQAVGIVSNPTGVMPSLRHEVDVMYESGKVDIVAAFGPEHGFRGTSQAGDGEDYFEDPKTGIPVYNAYNDKDKLEEFFEEVGLDTVVFDIQDIGSRFYTYIWTMYLAMEAAANLGKRFVVLDRPNPVSGADAYGPVLDPEHATFVGLKPISQKHGMSVGELAQLFNAEFLPESIGTQVDLTVVEMEGWRRGRYHDETGAPWVVPSPNMPQVDTGILYTGTCMFEATALSEGRGTTLPFHLIGAPGIDHAWEEALNARELPGVRFREAYFVPTFSKWVEETCGGVEVRVTDRSVFDPIRTGLAMIVDQRRLYPDYGWRDQDGDGEYWLDKLTGNENIRLAIEDGADVDDLEAIWKDDLEEFRAMREEHL
ncbi:MAG: exo-beta-N-acetylmuramidase NamZ family protein, partial [Stackebrandtia sp.]